MTGKYGFCNNDMIVACGSGDTGHFADQLGRTTSRLFAVTIPAPPPYRSILLSNSSDDQTTPSSVGLAVYVTLDSGSEAILEGPPLCAVLRGPLDAVILLSQSELWVISLVRSDEAKVDPTEERADVASLWPDV